MMPSLAVLVTAQVLTVANSNLIAIALPQLSAELGATAAQRQWIVDAFVLVFAALLVAGGVLADRYGRRRALLAGLALFAAGSVACALVSDPGLLIAARVLQALGPPLVLPASLSIVAATFSSPTARAKAIGVWGAGSGFGIAIGPLLGGTIVEGLGWRWAFGLSALAAAALGAAAVALIPGDRPAAPERRFDSRRRAAGHRGDRQPRVRADRGPGARVGFAVRARRVRRRGRHGRRARRWPSARTRRR